MTIAKIRFILINVFVTLILLTALETLVWTGLNNPGQIPSFLLPHFQRVYLLQDRSIIQVTACARYDPELFYTLNPGTCTFENREFSVRNAINPAGVRDDHQSLQGPAVVVLGDSFAMGWGVGQEEAFPQVLEGLTQLKVLNAGVSSYGTAREMMMLNRINTTRMKYLVIQYHRNDYKENVTYVDNGYRLPIRSKQQYDSLKRAIADRTTYYPFKYVAGISRSILKTAIRPAARDTTNSAREAKIFLDLVGRSLPERDSLTIIVFRADLLGPLKDDGFIAALDSLVQLDPHTWPNIVTFRADEVLSEGDFFILDDHINAHGHQKLARKISEYVEMPPHTVGTRILVRDN